MRPATYFRFLIKEVDAPKSGPIKYGWQFLSYYSFWCQPTSSSTGPEALSDAKIQPIPGRLILLCFDHTPKMRDIVCDAFKTVNEDTSRGDPFAMHAVLVDALVQQYERALWAFQRPIRNIEKVYSSARKSYILLTELWTDEERESSSERGGGSQGRIPRA